jgi:phosphopantothenoylcysteine decarboxylase/phosphopantothenate--cysteine ligase
MSNIPIFEDKRLILGVTGSIAAYKVATLASHLTQAGAQVDVVMTQSATRFVSPLTFQALTGRPVYTDMWQTETGGGLPTHIAHVGLAEGADLLVIAPATANTIAKLALGLADNLLSVTALAARCPVVVAPAMDGGMFDHPATQANLATLGAREGVTIVGPTVGRMASGLEGMGRMVEPEILLGACRLALAAGGPLSGHKIVATAGGTRESLDPVRFVSNRSSGKQGFALAQAALDQGAEVVLITAPASLPTPAGAERIDVLSTQDMLEAVLDHSVSNPAASALLMAAAASDFTPVGRAEHKIKKNKDGLPNLVLEATPDILGAVAKADHRPAIVVGFAAESQNIIENAREKLARKKLDLIVANDITAPDAGFAVDTNRVTLISAAGEETLPLMTKDEVAARVVEWVTDRLAQSM